MSKPHPDLDLERTTPNVILIKLFSYTTLQYVNKAD